MKTQEKDFQVDDGVGAVEGGGGLCVRWGRGGGKTTILRFARPAAGACKNIVHAPGNTE